jgi:hypothetical protein
MRLNIDEFMHWLEEAVPHYEKTSPTVSAYLDDLYIRITNRPSDVSLSELFGAEELQEEGDWLQPNYAANHVYKLMHRLGMDTTGHAGF